MKTLSYVVLALGLMAAPSFALDNLGGGKGDGKGPSCEQRAANSTQKVRPKCSTCSYQKAA